MYPLLKQKSSYIDTPYHLSGKPAIYVYVFYLFYFDSSRDSHKHANNAIQWSIKFTILARNNNIFYPCMCMFAQISDSLAAHAKCYKRLAELQNQRYAAKWKRAN